MVTFTINIPPMLAYIPYMDPMGTFINTNYPQCLGALTHIDPAFLDDFPRSNGIQGARGVHVCLDAGGWDAMMDPWFVGEFHGLW